MIKINRQKPEPPTMYPRTDAGNAELFAALNGDNVRFDWRRNRWLVFGDHHWRPDDLGVLTLLAVDAMRHRYRMAAEVADLRERDAEARFAIVSENKPRLDAMLILARSMPSIADRGDGWDRDPMSLGVQNGVVNLRDGTLRPGRQSDRITQAIPLDFDTAATCPRWDRFLVEVFAGKQDLIEFAQVMAGYCLTGSVQEQVFFLLIGPGGNGKSKFLEALRGIAGGEGAYAYSMPFATIERGREQSVSADKAALAGKRIVTASESSQHTRLNESRLKEFTGGEPISARFLYQSEFTFEPTHKLLLATNHLPAVDDRTDGLWRRVRVIPFEVKFEGADRDDRLSETLRGELPGILRWAVEGAVRWCRDGLPTPAAVAVATVEYQQSSDPLGDFLQDVCITGPGYAIGASDLYRAYKAWTGTQGIGEKELMTAAAFGRHMKPRFRQERTKKSRIYTGIAVRSDGQGDGFEDAFESEVTGLSVLVGTSPSDASREDFVPNASNPSQPVTTACGTCTHCRSGEPEECYLGPER